MHMHEGFKYITAAYRHLLKNIFGNHFVPELKILKKPHQKAAFILFLLIKMRIFGKENS